MPWFLNPSVYHNLPAYQNPELYLFILKLVVTASFAGAMWRRGARGRRLLAGTWVFFYGLFLAVMLSAHSLVILGLRLFERPAGAPFAYDFHLYALLLVGAVFISQGVRFMRAAPRLCAQTGGGRREALRASLVVLGLAVPLIPLQFFGAVLTVGSLVSVAAVISLCAPAAEGARAAAYASADGPCLE
jgi:hypothetical protein